MGRKVEQLQFKKLQFWFFQLWS